MEREDKLSNLWSPILYKVTYFATTTAEHPRFARSSLTLARSEHRGHQC